MDSIHQTMLKSGHLLHKIDLVKSQRNSTVYFKYQPICFLIFYENPCFTKMISFKHNELYLISMTLLSLNLFSLQL